MRDLLDTLFDELFPILRSITGPGLIQSLGIFARHMPLKIEMVPTGTQVFDWEVPPEWHLRSARLTHESGRVIADAAALNIHVVNYSEPVDVQLSREELQPYLHSLPDLPDAVPYATSYYNRSWGFCVSDNVRRSLPPGTYHAAIDSAFIDGGVPFAECTLPGECDREILLTSYLCHPSLANNELSGPLTLLALYQRLSKWPRRRYTYRFVLNPETIGALSYLYRRGEHLRQKMVGGMVLTCMGGPYPHLNYRLSRRGDSPIDLVMQERAINGGATVRAFDPTEGSDERQYCSPGFNLPFGQMTRSYAIYPNYHNSLDDKDYMSIDSVMESVDEVERVLRSVEIAGHFRNLNPFGEPRLGRRGLYPNTNVASTWTLSNDTVADQRTLLTRALIVLNYSDGQHCIYDVARKAGLSVEDFRLAIERLEEIGLLRLEPPEHSHEHRFSYR
jgi:aminopeptidase-like protein